MASDLYRQILREAHAQGREKADGFSKDVLLALFGDERQAAEDLLIELARKGDNTAIDALEAYDSERVRAALRGILTAAPCPSSTHCEAAWVLWKVTGDLEYRAALVANLDQPITIFQGVAINRVGQAGYTPSAVAPLLKILEDNRDKFCSAAAGRTLLHFAGLWPDLNGLPPEDLGGIQEIRRELWDDDPRKRQSGKRKLLGVLKGTRVDPGG